MSPLEEILNTRVGETQRLNALLEYARKLDLDITRARNKEGGLSEIKLILLIYDAEKRHKSYGLGNVGVWIGGFFILLMFATVIWLVNQF